MPRKPVVSRTMEVTKAAVLCVDPEAKESIEQIIILPRKYKTEEKLLKAARAAVQPNMKVVCVLATEKGKARFVMSEQEFINHAAMSDYLSKEI